MGGIEPSAGCSGRLAERQKNSGPKNGDGVLETAGELLSGIWRAKRPSFTVHSDMPQAPRELSAFWCGAAFFGD